MSIKATFSIAIAEILSQTTKFFLSVLVIGVCLGSIGYYSVFQNALQYNKAECSRLLTRGIDGTAAMQVLGTTSEIGGTQEILLEDAMDSGLFESIGTWESAVQGHPLPRELMDCRISNGGDPAEATKWIYIDRTALGIHNLGFARKKEVPEEKWNDPQWHGIYLGGNYAGIPLGSVYEIEKVGGYDTFEVIGILKKGQQFVSDGVMSEGNAGSIDALEVLDDAVIVPQGRYPAVWYWRSINGAYTPAEGVSLDEAAAYLEKKAAELDLQLEIGYLKDGFLAAEIEERDIKRVNRELYAVLFITCLLIGACILFMQLLEDRKTMGICFANGFSHGDLIRIYLWQSVLKVLAALALAYFAVRKLFDIVYREMYDYGGMGPAAIRESGRRSLAGILDRWVNHAALPGMLGAAAAVLAVCMAIPVLLVWRKVPAELLRDMRG